MVRLLSHGTHVIDIEEVVIQQILDIYPDERLHERKFFKEALATGGMSYTELVKECDVLHLPWQLFFLSQTKLTRELAKINDLRKTKFDLGQVASRTGSGPRISMRLLDRVMALQQYSKEYSSTPNPFCSSLQKIDRAHWVQNIIQYFDIDLNRFNGGKKERALEYLIQCLEAKNIHVSRGVLSNKILPVSNELRETYKQSSGFVVQDESVPYIFLPNEVNRDETAGRQIYTLVSLLILTGLGEYNILVNSDFEARVKGDRLTRRVHGAVAELLLPFEATTPFMDTKVSAKVRDDLSSRYNLTPTAVVITLRERGVITPDECEELLNSVPPKPPAKDQHFNSPKLTTSVEKFCGGNTNGNIVTGLAEKTLKPVRAQYLLFGHIDKKRLHTFKEMHNL